MKNIYIYIYTYIYIECPETIICKYEFMYPYRWYFYICAGCVCRDTRVTDITILIYMYQHGILEFGLNLIKTLIILIAAVHSSIHGKLCYVIFVRNVW
jgi:hypothetical protein